MGTIIRFIIILASAFALLAAFSVVAAVPAYFLWNWLMPELFGLKAITWLQAIGLNFMTGVLFKSSSIGDSTLEGLRAKALETEGEG